MPSVNLPDFNSKEMWRNLRYLFWSFLVAYSVVVFFGIMVPPEPIAGFMSFVILVAVWVVAYNFLFSRKT
jgi:hypothetical protein